MPCKPPRIVGVLLVWAAAALAGAATAQDRSAFQEGLDAYVNGEYRAAMEHWRPVAESGDAVAAFNIGVLYAQGLGLEADPEEAVRWYRQSAHAGYANAQFNLGAAYYSGDGIEKNIPQAVSWWEKAAAQDHAEALYNLATLYRHGRGVQPDAGRARALFSKAASLGDTRARQALADMGSPAPDSDAGGAADGGATVPDASGDERDQGDESGHEAAPPGRADSLGNENPDHWTVQVFAGTEEAAARRFARDHGLTDSLRIYKADIDGKTWFKGIYGSYADRAEAGATQAELARELPGSEPWLRSFRAIQAEAVGEIVAGEAGDGAAAGGAPRGEPSASEASRSSAAAPENADDGGRADEAAGSVESGRGASTASASPSGQAQDGGSHEALRAGQKAFNAQDYAAALEAWRPLAEQGVAEAQYGLGFMYESGWGVEQDYGEAFRWYHQAAQQGHVKAQYNLGMLYRNGRGVAQNDALGLYWIQTAADRGDERAENFLKESN